MKKEYISTFFTTWFILLILNQTFIFGCFAPYCLLAGLVPTGIVAFFVAPFFVGSDSTSDSVEKKSTLDKVVEKTENISNALETHNQELSDAINDVFGEKVEDKLDPNEIIQNAKLEVKAKKSQNQSYKEKAQNKSKTYEESEDHLKRKGDQYEKYIGMQFEKKGELAIYNGFIRGYDDDGVDIITICTKTKTIHLIQCKNWTKKPMVLDDVKAIYDKLENFRLNRINHKAKEIQEHLQEYKSYENIEYVLKTNKSDYDIRKTLYVGSDKVIDLNIGKHLKLIKPTIFRYEDMKIVIKRLGR